jgi:hypothetical protein
VNIRPAKVKVYLNGLSEEGQFECRLQNLKYTELAEHDVNTLLLQCQKEFDTRSTLKYLYAEDGA